MMDVPADLGEKIMESIPASILSEIEDRMGVRIDSVDVQLKGARAESAPSTDS